MTEVLRTCTVRARSPHVCDYCMCGIAKGEQYVRSFNKFDGRVYTWKSHLHCDRLVLALWDYVDHDDGIDAYTFRDAVQTVMSEYYCPGNCLRWSNVDGCVAGDGMTTCLCRFDKYMQTHRLVQVRKASGERIWEMVKKEGAL